MTAIKMLVVGGCGFVLCILVQASNLICGFARGKLRRIIIEAWLWRWQRAGAHIPLKIRPLRDNPYADSQPRVDTWTCAMTNEKKPR